MARGGPRPGAGRPKGRSKRQFLKDEKKAMEQGNLAQLPENPVLPLDYMLRVLNDPAASQERKDKMAALAAPFCHARADIKTGKKTEREEAAKKAATGRFGARPAPNVIPMKKHG